MDGGQTVVGTPVTTSSCPTSAPVKLGTYPQLAVNPPFLSWGFTPQHHLVVPPAGTVNVAGQAVTLQNPGGTQNYFDTDWVSGTPILINGTYFHVRQREQLVRFNDTGKRRHADRRALCWRGTSASWLLSRIVGRTSV